ncbi:hypothetical protein [Motilibacter aurantiacus]|uniref:hypothetical protein n=1 Tax=Motilibacter aurantiacus TaxID=2714955 RepID=UPI00140D0CB6|nr:hypothetical protein [Motilibacter aurantiacus]NHC45205.1 hypothetical protein [Motilibacter aurantiacus]
MSDGYALDPAELTAAGGALRDVAGTLAGQAGMLAVSPDAGAGSDEVRKAFAALGGGVEGVAAALRDAAEALDVTVSTYVGTDAGVSEVFGGMVPR